MWGIENGGDVFEYILCGAEMVQIGTQFYREGVACFWKIRKRIGWKRKKKDIKNWLILEEKLKQLIKIILIIFFFIIYKCQEPTNRNFRRKAPSSRSVQSGVERAEVKDEAEVKAEVKDEAEVKPWRITKISSKRWLMQNLKEDHQF